jgi:hypothetical protein
MADDGNHKRKKDSSNTVLIAIVGLVGTLGGAAISNWDKIFPKPSSNISPPIKSSTVSQPPIPLPSTSLPPSISPSTSPSSSFSAISIPPLPSSTPNPLLTPTSVPTKSVEISLITWSKTVNNLSLRQSLGLQFSFKCPPSRDQITRLYGTDIYTGHSSICEAGVHSGVITQNQGGVVTIKVSGSQKSFVGSQRSGVLSKGYPQYYSSFEVIP